MARAAAAFDEDIPGRSSSRSKRTFGLKSSSGADERGRAGHTTDAANGTSDSVRDVSHFVHGEQRDDVVWTGNRVHGKNGGHASERTKDRFYASRYGLDENVSTESFVRRMSLRRFGFALLSSRHEAPLWIFTYMADWADLAYMVCPFHKRSKSANMRSESFIRNSKSRPFWRDARCGATAS